MFQQLAITFPQNDNEFKMKRSLALMILTFLSCSANNRNDMNEWKIKQGEGLKEFNEKFNDLVVVNEKTGFLFGVSETDDI
ncbi:MAG TPA: hypothetical protein VD772_05165, partial [Anseongella sp.]|nr:hypothetical protein [Anseongella sp.]